MGVAKIFQLKIGQFLAEVVSESIWSFSWQFGLASIGLAGAATEAVKPAAGCVMP